MPQMMPLNWLLLLLIFSLSWTLLAINLFFYIKNNNLTIKKKINHSNLNWSW